MVIGIYHRVLCSTSSKTCLPMVYTETTQVFEQLSCRMFGINQEYVSFLRKFDYSWYNI